MLGLPTRLSQYPDVKPDTPSLVAKKLESNGATKLGERQDITPKTVEEILARSLAA